MATQKSMSLDEAKKVVADALAKHGDDIDLRPLLASLPDAQRPMIARMFAELRKQGAIETTLEVNTKTGQVSHKVRRGKTNTP